MWLQKRKDLSATEGHVLLLEYFEEFPLMLSHPGLTDLHFPVCCSICYITCLETVVDCLSAVHLSELPHQHHGHKPGP